MAFPQGPPYGTGPSRARRGRRRAPRVVGGAAVLTPPLHSGPDPADPWGVQDEQLVSEDDVPGGFPAAPRPPDLAPAPRRRARGRVLLAAVVLVLVAAVAAALLVPPERWPWDRPARSPGTVAAPSASAPAISDPAATPSATVAPAAADRPTAGGATARLAEAPLPPPGGGPHAFATFQQNGVTPVAYDPCRPVHYVIRPDEAPDGGEAIVQAAVARISETTGLQFVYDGPTDEAPSDDRASFQP